jgi:hypothetical protein
VIVMTLGTDGKDLLNLPLQQVMPIAASPTQQPVAATQTDIESATPVGGNVDDTPDDQEAALLPSNNRLTNPTV